MKLMSRWMLTTAMASVALNAAPGLALASKSKPLLVPVSYSDAPVKYKTSSAKKATPVAAAPVAAAVAAPVDDGSGVKIAIPKNYMSRHARAIELALTGQTSAALKILSELEGLALPHEELDRVHLTMGRIYYQMGRDSQALDHYLSVKAGGASWLEALEERATVYMRLGQPQETIASLKTVLSPIYKDRTLSEPYFLASLAQLRVCDFKNLFTTMELFKTRFRDRVKTWENSGDAVSKLRLRETGETIQKMNLVEAEAIQRLYMDESGKRLGGKIPSIERSRNQLTFPMDATQETKEVWLDEVDDFKVSVKGCPQPTDSSLAKTEGKL